MPTSQNFDTSNKYIKYRIEVIVNSQSTENNTSNITVKVWFFRTNQGYSTYGSGTCYCNINGEIYSQSITPSQKITSSPIVLFEKSATISHENDGTKSLWVSAYIRHNAPVTSSDQGFTAGLPRIPRAAQFTGADDFNDEQNPKIYFNNPAGFRLQFKLEAGGNDHLIVRDNIRANNAYTFNLTESERNLLRAKTPNSNRLTVRFTVGSYMPGSSSVSNWSYGDRTMNIVNANPTFKANQLSYKDTNVNVINVTNNDQLIVRNKSDLQVSFTNASANKYASISKYQIIFNGSSQDKNSAGAYNLGQIDSSSKLKLAVKVVDSRGNSTTISKNVQILDWILPVINLTAKRVNNYEDDTKLTAKVDISSVNHLNSIEILQYRTKKVSDSAWSSWIDFQNDTETNIILDKLFAWNLEVQAKDKFGISLQSLIVPKGIPIMFFDSQKLSVGINCFPQKNESFEISGKTIFDMVYPVGSIYMSVSSVNPSTMFGGTWVSWGSGRMPVGVNTSDTSFNSAEKVGGNKQHRHSFRIGMHWYYGAACGEGAGDGTGAYRFSDGKYDGWARELESKAVVVNNAAYNNQSSTETTANGKWSYGDTTNESSLQPYITCYMWKRTA